jgi:hypothetical protein
MGPLPERAERALSMPYVGELFFACDVTASVRDLTGRSTTQPGHYDDDGRLAAFPLFSDHVARPATSWLPACG